MILSLITLSPLMVSNTSIHFQTLLWIGIVLASSVVDIHDKPKQRIKQHSESPLEDKQHTVTTQFHLLVSIKLLTISIKHSTTK